MNRTNAMVVGAVGLAALPAVSFGQLDHNWKNAAGGNWNVRTNWDTNNVPNAVLPDNAAEISIAPAAAAYTVQHNDANSYGVTALRLNQANATLEISNGSTLRYNAFIAQPFGISVKAGTLQLTNGTIAAAGGAGVRKSGLINQDRVFLEGASDIQADVLSIGQISVIGRAGAGGGANVTMGAVDNSGNFVVVGPGVDLIVGGDFANSGRFTAVGAAGNRALTLVKPPPRPGAPSPAATLTNTGIMQIKNNLSVPTGNVINAAKGTFSVDAGATINFATGSFTNQGGTVQGAGTISAGAGRRVRSVEAGKVTPKQVIAPGGRGGAEGGPFSAATLTIDGDYEQIEASSLDIDICTMSGGPGSGYSSLAVTGTAFLGGALTLNLVSGFSVSPGDEFDVLTATDIIPPLSESFITLATPTVSGITFELLPVRTGGIGEVLTVRVVSVPTPGGLAMAGVLGLALTRRRRG
jgi:hypothetical protein